MDKETKNMVSIPSFLCKSSWDFYRKSKCDSILSQWRMLFQAADSKGRFFIDLLDDNLNPIELSNTKGGPWLQHFSHSNTLCAQASWAITNHAPIGRLRFFPREEFTCPCGNYPIKTRWHILYECQRFNKYWNPRRDTIAHFTLYLQFNSSAFSFE